MVSKESKEKEVGLVGSDLYEHSILYISLIPASYSSLQERREIQVDNETISTLLGALGTWAPAGAAFIIFCVWGMPHIVPIINAIGKNLNDRHKTNLSHERSMQKIRNQIGADSAAAPVKKLPSQASNGRIPRIPKSDIKKGETDENH